MRGNKEEILHFFDINKILVNHSWDGAVASDINKEVNENNAK
jgi:predicted mannosyl-3-phosphoglycerate phosphatase (HAD superfamily)